ncbi:MAG: NrsF family protein [Myxococcota bacterium]
MDRKQFIDQLAAEPRPAKRLSTGVAIALWLAASCTFVVGATLATGDLRPGVGEQLRDFPRFAAECALGLVAGIFVFRTGLLLSVPGRLHWRRAVPLALALIALWIGAYVYGLWSPALEPSMVGKRPNCFGETFLFSSFPLALGLLLVARRAPLQRAWVGALVGAASTSLPALMMQVACMYDPRHILQFHLLPILIVGLVGGAIGSLVLRRV